MVKLIDDADPRVIKEGAWGLGGNPNDSYNGTLSYTVTVGASMKVSFNGSYIAVFGLFDSTSMGTITNYTIDGASPAQVTTPPAADSVLRQQFWIKQGLVPGPHTLHITMDKVNVDPNSTDLFEGTIWFDYFQVDDSNTDIPTVAQLDSTSFPQPTSSPSSSSDHGHGSDLPIGAIIGIVIGGVLLIGVVFLLLMRRRMHRDPRVDPPKEKTNSLKSLIEPFLLSHHAPNPSTSSTQIVAASSAKRLLFDPTLLVRGPPPPEAGYHKSTITSFIQNPDSASPPALPRPQSIGTSPSTSRDTLPPGAHPPILPPVPHLPQRSSTLLTTTQFDTTSASQHPGLSADDAVAIMLAPSSLVGTAIVPDGEEETGSTSPMQHVDSGVREPAVILAHSVRQKRVELPPVYSPF